MQLLNIIRLNRGEYRQEKIFRYAKNIAGEIDVYTNRLLGLLEEQKAFSFAHYNDGEMTFIKNHLNGMEHNEWFGRKQQQYNPELGQRLYEAITIKKENYFIGVPCSTCHPNLRAEAEKIIGENEFKIPAMVFSS